MKLFPRLGSLSRRQFCRGLLGMAAGAATSGYIIRAVNAQTKKIPTRESIHTLDQSKLEKIESAVGEMMERSRINPKDPKGWLANAEPHRMFCAVPARDGADQIHFSYWFLPWHRAYIAVTERKIREIAGDSSLAWPYWNWTVDRRIPERFKRQKSPLARARRFTQDRDLDEGEIDFVDSDPSLRELGVAALAATKFSAEPSSDPFTLARELRRSFGGVPRPNTHKRYGNSRLEGTPHGSVHAYVGGVDETSPQIGDMSNFATASRDPIFFSHHGNLDRLWEIWRSVAANKATEPNDDLFLKHKFVFPWLDGSPIEISVAETLDTEALGYRYDSLQVVPGPATSVTARPEAISANTPLPPILETTAVVPPTPEAMTDTRRYILVIEGVVLPERILSANVFISSEKSSGGRDRVRVGAISVVQNGPSYVTPTSVLSYDITGAVATLGTSKIRVSIVPNRLGGESRSPYSPIPYKAVRVVIESQ